MKSIKLIIPTLMILLLGACSESSTTSSETDDNLIEPEVNNYVMVATSQIECYDSYGNVLTGLSSGDAFYGQDADYLKGGTMSYTDNGDGTITDDATGLMWAQNDQNI